MSYFRISGKTLTVPVVTSCRLHQDICSLLKCRCLSEQWHLSSSCPGQAICRTADQGSAAERNGGYKKNLKVLTCGDSDEEDEEEDLPP